MKFLILFGPPAVGKMTVGQELENLTGMTLFHNHRSIDLVTDYFDYETKEFKHLVPLIRKSIMKEFAASDKEGLIFTFCWAFDEQKDEDFINECVEIFKAQGADIYYAELLADQKERLKRNATEHRLKHKPDKRDIESSKKNLLESDKKYELISPPGYFEGKNYIRIDNTELEPQDVAKRIADDFSLPTS